MSTLTSMNSESILIVFLCVREKGKVNFRMMADEVFMKRSEPKTPPVSMVIIYKRR